MKRPYRLLCAAILPALIVGMICAAALTVSGCAATPTGKLDQVEILYANTAGELNDLREAGKISQDTYHTSIAPNLRAAYAGIKRARMELKAGNTAQVDVLLKSINDALLKLQPLRPTSQSAIQAMPPVQSAQFDPVTMSLALAAAERIISAVGKLMKGDGLTPEEHAAVQAASDSEAARVDQLDPPTATET